MSDDFSVSSLRSMVTPDELSASVSASDESFSNNDDTFAEIMKLIPSYGDGERIDSLLNSLLTEKIKGFASSLDLPDQVYDYLKKTDFALLKDVLLNKLKDTVQKFKDKSPVNLLEEIVEGDPLSVVNRDSVVSAILNSRVSNEVIASLAEVT